MKLCALLCFLALCTLHAESRDIHGKYGDLEIAESKHHEEGGGEESGEDHFSKKGEKGDKGYKDKHEHEEGKKGHHDKEVNKNFS